MNSTIRLSVGSLSRITAKEIINEPIVQILGSKQTNDNRIRCIISDGIDVSNHCILVTKECVDRFKSGEFDKYSVIRFDKYLVSVLEKNDISVIIVNELTTLLSGSEVGRRLTSAEDYSVVQNNSSKTKRNISAVQQNIGSNVGFNSNVEPMITSSEQSNNYLTERREGNTSVINPENLCPINAITPFYNAWTIRARVTAKTQIKTFNSKRGDGKLFSFDVTDDSSEIRITAFNKECDKYFNIIEKDLVYYITKGIVKTANKRFSNLKSDYEITLTNDSVIELCNENIPLPKLKYKFVELKDLPNINVNTTVDVIAVIRNISDLESIISKKNNKEYKKRDIFLLDKNSIEVRMTVWGTEAESFDAIKGSIIAVKNALVGDFKGRTLSCVQNTTIEYDPDLPEAHILKGWYDREGQKATNIVSMSKTTDLNASNTFKYLSQINMNSVPNDSALYFNCRAVIVSTGRPQNSMYKSCGLNGCMKKVRDESNGLYHCDKCGTDSPAFQWRIMLSVCISDCTGDLWLTAFQEVAEKMIGLKVDELSETFERDPNQYNSIISGLVFKTFNFRIGSKIDEYNNEKRVKSTAFGVYAIDPIERSKKLIQNLKTWAQ